MKRASQLIAIALLLLGPAAYASTYGDVLGRSEIESIIKAEVAKVQELDVSSDFVSWSVSAIEESSAPSRAVQARELLTSGYHKFVAGVVSLVKEERAKVVTRADAERFRKSNTSCGPIPCNEKACCNFCQKPCG